MLSLVYRIARQPRHLGRDPRRIFGLLLLLLTLSANAWAASSQGGGAASHNEILQYQATGRFISAPDGAYFIYEWSRPYSWARDVTHAPVSVFERNQTFVYKVAT